MRAVKAFPAGIRESFMIERVIVDGKAIRILRVYALCACFLSTFHFAACSNASHLAASV